MKILSMTDRRLQDRIDARALLENNPGTDLDRVRLRLRQIRERGFDRGEDLAVGKLDARRVRHASAALEKFTVEDRAINHSRKHKKGDAKAEKKKLTHSGRPVTDRSIQAALSGKAISGPQKTRILRAVNRLLEQKKQDAVTLDVLF